MGNCSMCITGNDSNSSGITDKKLKHKPKKMSETQKRMLARNNNENKKINKVSNELSDDTSAEANKVEIHSLSSSERMKFQGLNQGKGVNSNCLVTFEKSGIAEIDEVLRHAEQVAEELSSIRAMLFESVSNLYTKTQANYIEETSICIAIQSVLYYVMIKDPYCQIMQIFDGSLKSDGISPELGSYVVLVAEFLSEVEKLNSRFQSINKSVNRILEQLNEFQKNEDEDNQER